jgi:hypothetical protein
VIVLVCIALGVSLRLGTGRGLVSLAATQIQGETFLLGMLVVQAGLPLLRLSGTAGRIAFWVWVATFPCMLAIAWLNRRASGMTVLGAGLLMNLLVIAANGGMPVSGSAVAMISTAARAGAIPATDFIHVLGTAGTRLPWLADVMPLSGPQGLRLVASPGDLLLYVGIVAFLGGAQTMQSGPSNSPISRNLLTGGE